MSLPYDPYDWYWRVGGSTTQVYSTRVDNYVLVSDANYVAWLALGGLVTDVSSEQEVGTAVSTTFQTPDPAASVVRAAYFDQLNRPLSTNARWIKANSASTSPTTGALLVDGGVGIAGNLNVGGTITGALALGSITGLGAGVATFLATPSSANLAAAVTGETGSGALVFATSPALVTPDIGTPSAGTLTNCTGLPATAVASPAALTAVNDTNVTLTLGGTPATALLRAASVTAGWTGTLAVSRGGSGAGTFTANGILYGSGTSAFGVTAQGAAGQLLLGQGAVAPAWATMGSDATITSAGALTIANSAVTFAKMQNSAAAGLSVIGRSANTAGVFAEISAASDAQVFRRSGTAVGFGAIDISSANAVVNRLAYANLTQGTARSVLGVTGNVTADVASIQGTADQALVINSAGTALAFGAVNLAAAAAVTGRLAYANITAPTAASRVLARGTTTGDWQECTLGTSLTFTTTALGVATSAAFTWTGSHTFTQNMSFNKSNAVIAADDGTSVTNIYIMSKGNTASSGFLNSSAQQAFEVIAALPSANYVRVYSGATGQVAALAAVGTDTNVTLQLLGQGTGLVYISSIAQCANTAASTSSSTGSLQVLGGAGVAGALNVGTYITAAAATGFWVAGKATGVNFNSANTDTSIPITLPSGYTRYRVTLCFVSHASISLTTATCGLFTGAGATGTTIVTLATTGITSTAENTNNNGTAMTIIGAATMTLNAATLYFRIGTAQGAAATADVTIYVTPLP